MTLADYLREIRASSFPYPKLGRSAIQSASHDQVLKWLAERNQSGGRIDEVADKKRLISFDNKMKPMSQREIAERAGVSLFLVNKVFTSGKQIRGTGLKKILKALGCQSDSPSMRKALSIWASESGMEVAPEDVDGLVSEKHGELALWWKRVYPHLIKMSSDQRDQIALAISRPAVISAIPALNSVFEAHRDR